MVLENLAFWTVLLFFSRKRSGHIQDGTSIRSLSEQDITNKHKKTQIEITISLNEEEITWSLSQEQKEGKSAKSTGEIRLEAIKSLIDGISTQRLQKLGRGDELTNALQAVSKVLIQIEADEVRQDPLKDLQTAVDEIKNQLVNDEKTSLPLAVLIDKLRKMRRSAIDAALLASEELTDSQIQRLVQGYHKPDADGRYTPFSAAIIYILKQYF